MAQQDGAPSSDSDFTLDSLIARFVSIPFLWIPALVIKWLNRDNPELQGNDWVVLWKLFLLTAPLTVSLVIIGIAVMKGWAAPFFGNANVFFIGIGICCLIFYVMTYVSSLLLRDAAIASFGQIPPQQRIDYLERSSEWHGKLVYFLYKILLSFWGRYGTEQFLSSVFVSMYVVWAWTTKKRLKISFE